MDQRIAWDDLPSSLKDAIKARTGRITSARTATAGQNSPLAAIIDTVGGKVFAKGMPSGHPRVIAQAREAAIAPFVGGHLPGPAVAFRRGRMERTGLRVRARPPRRLHPRLARP